MRDWFKESVSRFPLRELRQESRSDLIEPIFVNRGVERLEFASRGRSFVISLALLLKDTAVRVHHFNSVFAVSCSILGLLLALLVFFTLDLNLITLLSHVSVRRLR